MPLLTVLMVVGLVGPGFESPKTIVKLMSLIRISRTFEDNQSNWHVAKFFFSIVLSM